VRRSLCLTRSFDASFDSHPYSDLCDRSVPRMLGAYTRPLAFDAVVTML
jgi:hypothetical protein